MIQILHDFAVKKRNKNDLVQENTKKIQQLLEDVQKYSSKGSTELTKFLKASYRKEATLKDIQAQWLSYQLYRMSNGKEMTEISILSKQVLQPICFPYSSMKIHSLLCKNLRTNSRKLKKRPSS